MVTVPIVFKFWSSSFRVIVWSSSFLLEYGMMGGLRKTPWLSAPSRQIGKLVWCTRSLLTRFLPVTPFLSTAASTNPSMYVLPGVAIIFSCFVFGSWLPTFSTLLLSLASVQLLLLFVTCLPFLITLLPPARNILFLYLIGRFWLSPRIFFRYYFGNNSGIDSWLLIIFSSLFQFVLTRCLFYIVTFLCASCTSHYVR